APRSAPMAHYFVAANFWFIAGLVLLLGGQNLFGYVRLEPAVYWGAIWATFGLAAVCARRWRAASESPRVGGSPPAARDVAAVCLVGLVLLGIIGTSILPWAVSRGHFIRGELPTYAVLVMGCLGVGAALLFVWLIRIVRGPKSIT